MNIRIYLSAAVVMTAVLSCVALPGSLAQTSVTGISSDFNPAISVNTLLLGRLAEETTEPAYNGMDLQESEIQISSIVDPYWKADLVLAFHPGHEGEGYETDVEVARVSAQQLPGGFGLDLGRDYLPFGKHAPLHTHQFAFVESPAAVSTFLGDHSLAETGLRLSHELPLPWYADAVVYGVGGASGIFDAEFRDPAYGARWTNLLETGDSATLELGGSWLHGRMAPGYLMLEEGHETHGALDVFGADLTWKWIDSRASRGRALTLTGEVILPRPEAGADSPLGWYAIAQYRFARNWWLGVTAGGLDRDLAPDDEHGAEAGDEHEHDHEHESPFAWERVIEAKANLTWAPSEFSSVRLEAARYEDPDSDRYDTVLSLQVNFTIGSHPAHLY